MSDDFPDQGKLHETPEHRHQELLTLRQYAAARNFTCRQAKPLLPYDGVCYEGNKPVELVEIKNRNNPKEQYPTLKIDKKKVDDLLASAARYQLRAVLVVNWQGEINWLDLSEIAENSHPDEALFPEATIKRRDRQEMEDRVYCIDILLFRLLGTHEQQSNHTCAATA